MDALAQAATLIIMLDRDLFEILWLSVRVSLIALAIATLIALPLGTYLAITRFPGRGLVITLINSLMGMPPVVVGLMVYLMLSRSGPLGWLGLLYTPTAMIIAQIVLITPIIVALSTQVIEDLVAEYEDTFKSLGVAGWPAIKAYLIDARFSLTTCVLAGFGRAIAEVGAVIIVGGNIDHLTRVMTTAIALETSRGNLDLALALGAILLMLALTVTAAVSALKDFAKRRQYV